MKEFKRTIKKVAEDILEEEEIISKELVKAILNHKHKITNRKLIEEVFEYMLNTELWKTKRCYCGDDVRVAIGKCLINRLNINHIK